MIRWCLLVLLAMLAGGGHSLASAPSSGMAIQVSPPQRVSEAGFQPLGRRVAGVHTVRIGEMRVAARVRYGAPDLLDADAIATAMGAEFHRVGGGLSYDRPASDHRIWLDLTTGALKVDGISSGAVRSADVVVSERLWISAEALAAMTGLPVSVPGRPSQTNDTALAAVADRPVVTVAPQMSGIAEGPEPQLVLASATLPPPEGTTRPAQWMHELRQPRPLSLEGVFGRFAREARTTPRSTDWRGEDSWQIEPVSPPRPAETRTRQPRLQNAAMEVYVQPERAAKTPEPIKRQLNTRSRQLPQLHRISAEPGQSESYQRAPFAGVEGLASNVATDLAPKKQPVTGLAFTKVAETPPAVGAIRGVLTLDLGEAVLAGPQEQRLEGELVTLIDLATSETVSQRTASFGAFAFEGLRPGLYRLRSMSGWQEQGTTLRVGNGVSEIVLAVGSPEFIASSSHPPPLG